jgi:hypothetical protein
MRELNRRRKALPDNPVDKPASESKTKRKNGRPGGQFQ